MILTSNRKLIEIQYKKTLSKRLIYKSQWIDLRIHLIKCKNNLSNNRIDIKLKVCEYYLLKFSLA